MKRLPFVYFAVIMTAFVWPEAAAAAALDATDISALLAPLRAHQDGDADTPGCQEAVTQLSALVGDNYRARWNACQVIKGLEQTMYSTLPPRSLATLNTRLIEAGLYRADCKLPASPEQPATPVH